MIYLAQDLQIWIMVVIFFITFFLFTTELIEKWIATVIGVLLLFFFKLLNVHEILGFINFDVIFMIVGFGLLTFVARSSGFFDLITIKIFELSGGDRLKIFISLRLLGLIIGSFLYTIAGLIMLLPLSINVSKRIKLNVKLFILGEIFFANMGGLLTIVGDPTSTIIGTVGGFSPIQFFIATGPTIILVSTFTLFFLYFLDRKSFRKKQELFSYVKEARFAQNVSKKNSFEIKDRFFVLGVSFIMLITILGLFFPNQLHLSPGKVALIGGLFSCLLFFKKISILKLVQETQWKTIFFFIGLSIMFGVMGKTGIPNIVAIQILSITTNPYLIMAIILFLTAGISMFLDNVAFVTLMIPIILELQHHSFIHHPDLLLWALLFGAVFGGMVTPFGSANVTGVGIASRFGYRITPVYFFKKSIIVVFVALLIAYLSLAIAYLF